MKRPVLHLLRSAEIEETGPARIVAALATGLKSSQYELHAWCMGPHGPLVDYLRANGAHARSIDWLPGSRSLLGALRFWRGIRANDFAIVHHHFGGRVVRQLVRVGSRARIVVHVHACFWPVRTDAAVNSTVALADRVVVASKAIALQIPTAKPAVIYAGVEQSLDFSSQERRADGDIVIGCACRLVDIKGLVHLLRAFAKISAEFPGLRLEIAGVGPERSVLEREAAHLKLSTRIRFLGWQANIRATLRRWDIFAMPSLTEAMPLAALEAMSEGLPVIASNVGGMPELVDDGRTGYLVPPADAALLSQKMRELARSRRQRLSMGAAGRERVRDEFSTSQLVSTMEALYDSVLDGAPRTDRGTQKP